MLSFVDLARGAVSVRSDTLKSIPPDQGLPLSILSFHFRVSLHGQDAQQTIALLLNCCLVSECFKIIRMLNKICPDGDI